MSKTQNRYSLVLAVVAGVALFAASVKAQTLNAYITSATQNNNYVQGPSTSPTGYTEYGNQISLAMPAGNYPLVTFSFEYYAANLVGGETVTLRLYDQTGAATANTFTRNAPGNLLFDSTVVQPIAITAGYHTVDVNLGGALSVPQTFTWTVKFNNLQQGDTVGLPIYTGTVIGSFTGTGFFGTANVGVSGNTSWSLYQITQGGNNVPAIFAASAVIIPEPSVIQLGLFAGAGWLGLLAMRRRS